MNLDYIFWEDMPSDEFILQTSGEEVKPTLTFSRDENYRLICNIKTVPGYQAAWDNNFGKGRKAGKLYSDIQVISAVTLHGHLKAELEINPSSWASFSPKEVVYEPEAAKVTLRWTIAKDHDTKTLVYFFLSNINAGNICFPGHISLETSSEAKIKLAGTIDDMLKMPMMSRHSWGCFQLKINEKNFIFGKVDKKTTNNLPGAFLRFEKDNFPTENELFTIINFLVYLTGSELIPIGHIKFGANYSINEQVFLSTFRDNTTALLRHNPMPVIPLGLKAENGKGKFLTDEKTVSFLLTQYSATKDSLPLDYLVYCIKCFRAVSLDFQMNILATAFDFIRKAWFKSEKSSSGGKYLQDKKFLEVMVKHLSAIESELGSHMLKKKIINNLKNANHFTLQEESSVFFEEIGLKIGEVEKEIIRQRHKSIHGELRGRDYQKLVFMTYGAYSLLNKIVLKLLGYEGLFVDYSSYNFPSRNMDEPLGGPIEDGPEESS